MEGAKIDPLSGDSPGESGRAKNPGLDDEAVDSARIEPVGEVREEMDLK